jgi:hypothetical protein
LAPRAERAIQSDNAPLQPEVRGTHRQVESAASHEGSGRLEFDAAVRMSRIGPERTLSHVRIESAVEGKADIRRTCQNVAY